MAFQPDLTNPVTTPLERISYGAPYATAIIAFTLWLDVCTSFFIGIPLIDFTFIDFSALAAGKAVVYVAGFSAFMLVVRTLHLLTLQELGDQICYVVAKIFRAMRVQIRDDSEEIRRKERQDSNNYRFSTRGYVLEHQLREYALVEDNQSLKQVYDSYAATVRSEQNTLSAVFAIAVLVLLYQFLPISSAHWLIDPSRFYAAALASIFMWLAVSYFGIKSSHLQTSGLIYVGNLVEEKVLGSDEYRRRHEPMPLDDSEEILWSQGRQV